MMLLFPPQQVRQCSAALGVIGRYRLSYRPPAPTELGPPSPPLTLPSALQFKPISNPLDVSSPLLACPSPLLACLRLLDSERRTSPQKGANWEEHARHRWSTDSLYPPGFATRQPVTDVKIEWRGWGGGMVGGCSPTWWVGGLPANGVGIDCPDFATSQRTYRVPAANLPHISWQHRGNCAMAASHSPTAGRWFVFVDDSSPVCPVRDTQPLFGS